MTIAIVDARGPKYIVIGAGAEIAGVVAAQAAASAQSAIASATAAANHEASASDFADLAEIAALTLDNIYPNTTAGLAAVAEGGYFWTSNPLKLWRDLSGVAVEQDAPATRAALAASAGAQLIGLTTGTVGDALKYITPEMFEAAGDGVADDAAALQATIADGRPVRWPKKTYRIVSAISHTATSDIEWENEGATIVYDGSHAEAAITITTSAKLNINLGGVKIDGGKKCNVPLRIRSEGGMANACTVICEDLHIKRAKKNTSFGACIGAQFLGSFEEIRFNGGSVTDCEMPTGSGTPSVSGVAGINVAPISTDKWCRRLIVNGTKIEKIYSSDLSYTSDQDGIGYFVPDDASDAGKVDSLLVVMGGASFKNCYGRSVKTQCRDTIVTQATFLRTEGYNGGVGDTEIDAQSGTLFVGQNTHDYRNGFSPNAISRCLGGAAYGPNGLNLRDVTVYLDSATTLERGPQTFPNDGYTSSAIIEGLRIFGKVKEPVALIFNGPHNYASVKNCVLSEIVNGATSQKALVYVRYGGVGSADGLVEIDGNVYTGVDAPSVARTQIPGAEMTALISSSVNPGFANVVTGAANPAGLHTKQVKAFNSIGGATKSGIKFVERWLEITVAPGETATIPVLRSNGAARITILEGTAGSGINYIEFWSANDTNNAVKIGPNFGMDNTVEPGAGAYRVWSSATNQLSLKNTDTGTATFSLKIKERG